MWVSVNESLPKKEVLCLIAYEGRVSVGVLSCGPSHPSWWEDRMRQDGQGEFIDVWAVTHWMPMPEFHHKSQ
jgi:hypothetical protein